MQCAITAFVWESREEIKEATAEIRFSEGSVEALSGTKLDPVFVAYEQDRLLPDIIMDIMSTFGCSS